MMDEDWNILLSLLPPDWREQARETGAVKGLRKDKSAENLLRTLLLHLACGYSLRETAVRAREAQWAAMSDVALLKRLRKCQDWLAALCRGLFADRGVHLTERAGFEVRLIDATTVKEPGPTGSLWRIHYSLRLPSLRCDFFKVTPGKGAGNGESLRQFPLEPGDHVIADRGYGNAPGIASAAQRQAAVLVRLSPHNLKVLAADSGQAFRWEERLAEITRASQPKSWPVLIPVAEGQALAGRVCAVRKTEQAIRLAQKRLRRLASKRGEELQPETLLYAEYVLLFTTFAEDRFSTCEVLHWYRLRWQVELVFKRFKQLAGLGHLPKYTEESAKAWLYGKLFTALMVEKLIWQARAFSPWGHCLRDNEEG